MSPRSNQKLSFGQRSTLEKHVTSMSCRLEPAIWSHDTGQQIPYFDRCQLTIIWMSDIKEVHGKPSLHVSVNLLLEYGRHVARLHRRRRRRRAYAPTNNTAIHGTHEKIISWVPFSSLIWLWGSAITKKTLGDRSFMASAPKVGNRLQSTIREANDLNCLRHFLKHISLDRHFYVCFYSSFLKRSPVAI